MKKSLIVGFSLLMLGCGGQPQSRTLQQTFWPLHAGDTWTMQDTSTGYLTHWQILPAPPAPSSPQFMARITKDRCESYWNPGLCKSVDYTLLIGADESLRSPASISYSTLDASGSAVNTVVTPAPSNELLTDVDTSVDYLIYNGYVASADARQPDAVWSSVKWSTRTVIITEAGDLFLQATYREDNVIKETWTFQRNVGPQDISWDYTGCNCGLIEHGEIVRLRRIE